MYKLLRPLLFTQDSESIHQKTIKLCQSLSHPLLSGLIGRFYEVDDERLESNVFGLDFKNPVGLAAGFDKNGELLRFLPYLGFGFMEVGTVTAKGQGGNPKPRLFRLPQDNALINRMGFNNEGVEALARRLLKRPHDVIVGGNIGKTKLVPNEQAIWDYETSFIALADYVDFLVINVSSPNTPGLRELQEREPLAKLLKRICELNHSRAHPKPVLLKIAPDLSKSQLDDIMSVCSQTDVAGVVATNTTILRDGLRTPAKEVRLLGDGGLSGKPLTKRSIQIIRYLYRKSQGRLPIIGVGGVFCAKDAYEKIKAGASLVELYTGLIYEGPGLVKSINQGILKLLERDGFWSIKEAVGVESSL